MINSAVTFSYRIKYESCDNLHLYSSLPWVWRSAALTAGTPLPLINFSIRVASLSCSFFYVWNASLHTKASPVFTCGLLPDCAADKLCTVWQNLWHRTACLRVPDSPGYKILGIQQSSPNSFMGNVVRGNAATVSPHQSSVNMPVLLLNTKKYM